MPSGIGFPWFCMKCPAWDNEATIKKKNLFPFLAVLEIPHLFIKPRIEQARCVEPWQSLDMEAGPQEWNRRASRRLNINIFLSSGTFGDLNEQLFIERVSLT